MGKNFFEGSSFEGGSLKDFVCICSFFFLLTQTSLLKYGWTAVRFCVYMFSLLKKKKMERAAHQLIVMNVSHSKLYTDVVTRLLYCMESDANTRRTRRRSPSSSFLAYVVDSSILQELLCQDLQFLVTFLRLLSHSLSQRSSFWKYSTFSELFMILRIEFSASCVWSDKSCIVIRKDGQTIK
jgi:hypothetical protein